MTEEEMTPEEFKQHVMDNLSTERFGDVPIRLPRMHNVKKTVELYASPASEIEKTVPR